MTEVEMEAAVLAVLDALPKPWRVVVTESGLHEATASRILERLKQRNQVTLTGSGYVLASVMSVPAVKASTVMVATMRASVASTGPLCSVCHAPLTKENWTPGARKMGWQKCRVHLRSGPAKQHIVGSEAVRAASEPALTPKMRSQLRIGKRKYTRRTPVVAPPAPTPAPSAIVPVHEAAIQPQAGVSMTTALTEVIGFLEGYRDRLTEAITGLRKL